MIKFIIKDSVKKEEYKRLLIRKIQIDILIKESVSSEDQDKNKIPL